MRKFFKSESGAVTVDWTVLTAAIIGMGIASVAAVRTGVVSLSDEIQAALGSVTLGRLFGPIAQLDLSNTDGLETTPWGWVATGSFQGWFTIGANNRIEISRSGQRVTTPDGSNWIDLEYFAGNVTLARVLDNVAPGQSMQLSFNAADSSGNNAVDVYFAGQLIERVQPTQGTTFQSYTLDLVAGTGDGSNQLEFRGVGPQDSVGVSLNGIVVQ
jgi:Flp pilus assembly pilin Flp